MVTCRHKVTDFGLVAKHARLVVDSRNAFPRNGASAGKARIVRL